MTERVIDVDGIELATEAFGNPAHAPVLLIMGGGASMLWWPEAFCERLANHGRYVIRYDQRETGLSTPYVPGGPSFSFEDLVADVMRILDGYALPSAHLVGMSLGGMVGQIAALRHPSRVRSLTAISSSPIGSDTSQLPPLSEAYSEHLAASESVDWSDRAQAIAYLVDEARIVAGTTHPFMEAEANAFVARDYDRAGGFPSSSNFDWRGREEWRGRLHELRPPLLVIHGTVDPVFPVEHGIALAAAVPGASLVRLDEGGHELHEADWDEIIAAVVKHTGR